MVIDTGIGKLIIIYIDIIDNANVFEWSTTTHLPLFVPYMLCFALVVVVAINFVGD